MIEDNKKSLNKLRDNLENYEKALDNQRMSLNEEQKKFRIL